MSFLDQEQYVRTDKMKQWFEGILNSALNTEFTKEDAHNVFFVDGTKYYFYFKKSGPAFTICITESATTKKSFVDIDLVPCLQFTAGDWPADKNFRENTSKKDSFFVVPKKPTHGGAGFDRYWRLSFQEQESELLANRQSLKPALKLLKLLRDKNNHTNISSYFIKTMFLWEIDNGDESFWRKKLSFVFMKMLERYHEMLKEGKIPYYWDRRFNLIGNIKPVTLENMRNQMGKALGDIKRNIADPFIVATYLVPKEQLAELKEKVVLGKKNEKRRADCVDGNSVRTLSRTSSSVSVSNSVGSYDNKNIDNIDNTLKELEKKVDQMLHEQREVRTLLYELLLAQGNVGHINADNMKRSK